MTKSMEEKVNDKLKATAQALTEMLEDRKNRSRVEKRISVILQGLNFPKEAPGYSALLTHGVKLRLDESLPYKQITVILMDSMRGITPRP